MHEPNGLGIANPVSSCYGYVLTSVSAARMIYSTSSGKNTSVQHHCNGYMNFALDYVFHLADLITRLMRVMS